MNTKLSRILALVVLSILATQFPSIGGAAEAPKTSRPNIYDETLDGSRQVAVALAKAQKENQRVLLQFGANWCGWCHKLHRLFESNKEVSTELKTHYVVVLVDVNQGHNADLQKKYEAERLGLPCLVVLDATGKHLVTQNTGDLEEGDHHSPAKVLAFLKKWAPTK